MIGRLLVGIARSLFTVATLLALAAVLALYGAYRALRAATVGTPPPPIRTAGFELLAALVTLGRAMQAATPSSSSSPLERLTDELTHLTEEAPS